MTIKKILKTGRISTKDLLVKLQSKRALIVDNNPVHSALLEKTLQEYAFQVVVTTNGFQALDLLDSGQTFDLIIMEIDMPELNGLETIRSIRWREHDQGKPRTPAVAFTTKNTPKDRNIGLKAGMDTYVCKSILVDGLWEKLIESLQTIMPDAPNLYQSDHRKIYHDA